MLVALASAMCYRFGYLANKSHMEEDFETDKRDAHIFTVVDLPGKGKGVIAARDIQVSRRPVSLSSMHVDNDASKGNL
jgi:hypothetical protein